MNDFLRGRGMPSFWEEEGELYHTMGRRGPFYQRNWFKKFKSEMQAQLTESESIGSTKDRAS